MIERFLFVVGAPNTGKSTQLRSLFIDPRLGTDGQVPTSRKVEAHYKLSIDRRLYLRLTSPHEYGESLKDFLQKTAANTTEGRWCAAVPLQPDASEYGMTDLVKTVKAVIKEFTPERVRVCILSPDRHGNIWENKRLQKLFGRLWRLGPVECHCIDARERTTNGTLLAGYLDYS
jgi:hypothetical protein